MRLRVRTSTLETPASRNSDASLAFFPASLVKATSAAAARACVAGSSSSGIDSRGTEVTHEKKVQINAAAAAVWQ